MMIKFDKIDLLYDLMQTLDITIDKELDDLYDNSYCHVSFESFNFDDDENLLTIDIEYEGDIFSTIVHAIKETFLVRDGKVYRIDNDAVYYNFIKFCNISIRWHNMEHDDPDYII